VYFICYAYYINKLNLNQDENVGKMKELLEVLQVMGARMGLKFSVKKTKSLVKG